MKITNVMKRRAISPVIATVILIAITLIAAIAIAGFVFGLFPGFTASAQVTQGTSNLSATKLNTANVTNTGGFVAECFKTPGAGSYVGLSNSGTGSTTVTAVSLILQGKTYLAVLDTTCTTVNPVAASSTIYLRIFPPSTAPNPALSAGASFGGTVTLANSGQVPLSGVLAP